VGVRQRKNGFPRRESSMAEAPAQDFAGDGIPGDYGDLLINQRRFLA